MIVNVTTTKWRGQFSYLRRTGSSLDRVGTILGIARKEPKKLLAENRAQNY